MFVLGRLELNVIQNNCTVHRTVLDGSILRIRLVHSRSEIQMSLFQLS